MVIEFEEWYQKGTNPFNSNNSVKCLNCHSSMRILQHLLEPTIPSETSIYLDALSYILGIETNHEEFHRLKLMNITELTFCKNCNQLLIEIYKLKNQFVEKTVSESYLWTQVLKRSLKLNSRFVLASDSPTAGQVLPTTLKSYLEKLIQNPVDPKSRIETEKDEIEIVEDEDDDEVEIVSESLKLSDNSSAMRKRTLQSR